MTENCRRPCHRWNDGMQDCELFDGHVGECARSAKGWCVPRSNIRSGATATTSVGGWSYWINHWLGVPAV